MSDIKDLEKAIAESIGNRRKPDKWACRTCGEVFDKARDARRCTINHDTTLGVKAVYE